jgi:hypothetical protein
VTIDFTLQATTSEKLPAELAAEPVKREFNTIVWMGIAFAIALALTAAVLAVNGTDSDSLRTALRLTGRWSFLVFWFAYAGGAVATLSGSAFARFAKRGRDFGLAYASAQSVHLGLVIWLFLITLRPPLNGKGLVLFTVAMILTYTLAVFSVGGMSNVLGSRRWRALRVIGMNYILFAFAVDFVPITLRWTPHNGAWRLVEHAPFAAMCLAAPVLVAAAAARRRLAIRHKGPMLNQPSTDLAQL